MSSELKNFPPSDLKLDELRRSGVIPFSEEVLIAGVLGALLFSFWLLSRGVGEGFLEFASEQFGFEAARLADSGQAAATAEARLSASASRFGFLIFSFVFAVPAAVLIFGFLQTRLLVAPKAMAVRFGRLFSLSGFGLTSAAARAGNACYRIILFIAWIVVSWLILRYVFLSQILGGAPEGELEELPQRAVPFTIAALRKLLEAATADLLLILLAAAGFTLLIGSGAYFITLLKFRRTHRMTRSEVEAEYREMEAAPEFRSARADRQAEELE